MARTLTVLALGALLGVVATLLLRPSAPALPELGDLPPTPATAPAANAVVTAAAREGGRDFYRQLADANVSELASMIAQAAAEPSSTDRELALAVLLKRYSELDALGAVRLAREARVGGAALTAVYGAWARTAPGQALAALSTIDNPDDAAAVALALIAALGNDAAAVGRVAAVLAAREEETPVTGIAGPFGPVISPTGPFGLVAPRSALALTAQRWADLDPRRALAVASEVGDERVRRAVEAAALRTLARVAPDEAFAHLANLDAPARELQVLGGTLVELARADPERLLSAVRDMPPDTRRIAESAALQQLAERDPLAAWRYVERMPLTGERQGLAQVVARQYGKRDAAAALAWARELPGQPFLLSTVIAGVAEDDPDRALDLALGLPSSSAERIRALQFAMATVAREDSTAERMANRLLTVDDPAIRDMVAPSVISMWAARSPDAAMQWLLANGQATSPSAFQQIGQQLAMRDSQSALGYTAQVPAAAREAWVHGVAQGYAQNDPQGAIDWLGRFRGEEWYGRAATTVAMTVAQRDGAAAARLVDELPADAGGEQPPRLVSVIATNWANQDPAAAADWSLARATGQERDMAVRGVVGVWTGQDTAAARQWTLRLPQGALRDGALTTVLTATAMQRSGNLDAAVLNAFASPQAQQTAVLQVVQSVAFADPAKARAIADAHLDAAFRAQAEAMIDGARNQRGPQAINLGVTQSQLPVVRVR